MSLKKCSVQKSLVVVVSPQTSPLESPRNLHLAHAGNSLATAKGNENLLISIIFGAVDAPEPVHTSTTATAPPPL